MFIGETSSKEWRGATGVLNQLLITIGILIDQVFGLSQLMGTPSFGPTYLRSQRYLPLYRLYVIPYCQKIPVFY